MLSNSEIEAKVKQWLDDGGRDEIRRILEEAEETRERLRKARLVDPETLNRPFDI